MEQTIRKMIKTGYGLGLLSAAEAKKVAYAVKKELDLDEKESMRLAQELVRSSAAVSKDVLGRAQKEVEKALLKSKVVNKAELAVLKKGVKMRVEKLRRKEESAWGKMKRKVMKK